MNSLVEGCLVLRLLHELLLLLWRWLLLELRARPHCLRQSAPVDQNGFKFHDVSCRKFERVSFHVQVANNTETTQSDCLLPVC